jgi:hypothetical protein
MTVLNYKPHAQIEDLAVGECTVHSCAAANGLRWWQLWFRVEREDNGQPADFVVPIAPHGSLTESGPGGKTWGVTRVGAGLWQVSPSINVLAGEVVAGAHPEPSIWHRTPQIDGVPDSEHWAAGAQP